MHSIRLLKIGVVHKLLIATTFAVNSFNFNIAYGAETYVNHWPSNEENIIGTVNHVTFNFSSSSQLINVNLYKKLPCCSVDFFLNKLSLRPGLPINTYSFPAYHKINHQIFFSPLGPGKYEISWSAINDSGRLIEGSFEFTVN